MRFFHKSDSRQHGRSRSGAALLRSNKLLVEQLEWRGMLSATVGSLADVVTGEEVVGDEWVIADTSTDPAPEGEVFVCTFLPPGDWLSEPDGFEDSVVPPDFELPRDDGVDPVITTDPVVIDPVVFEPIDLRVQFVSSDPGWAVYLYSVGSDGLVQGVAVIASYDEPTIAAFVAEHRDDPSVYIFDDGENWLVSGFPLESAPPVPDQPNFLTWLDSVDDAVVPDGGSPVCEAGPESEATAPTSNGGQVGSIDAGNLAAAVASLNSTDNADAAEAASLKGRRRGR